MVFWGHFLNTVLSIVSLLVLVGRISVVLLDVIPFHVVWALTPWKPTHYTLRGCNNYDSYQRLTFWRMLLSVQELTVDFSYCYVCVCVYLWMSVNWSFFKVFHCSKLVWFVQLWIFLWLSACLPLLKLWYDWPGVHGSSFWRIIACEHTILPIENHIILWTYPKRLFLWFFTIMLNKTFLCQGHWNLSSFSRPPMSIIFYLIKKAFFQLLLLLNHWIDHVVTILPFLKNFIF